VSIFSPDIEINRNEAIIVHFCLKAGTSVTFPRYQESFLLYFSDSRLSTALHPLSACSWIYSIFFSVKGKGLFF